MQDIGMEPDPLVGNHNEDAHAQLESAELEILTNKKDGLLHQVEEVEGEGTGEVIAAVDEGKGSSMADLQGLGSAISPRSRGQRSLLLSTTIPTARTSPTS